MVGLLGTEICYERPGKLLVIMLTEPDIELQTIKTRYGSATSCVCSDQNDEYQARKLNTYSPGCVKEAISL